MSKSQKGKKASKRLVIEQMKKTINEKFKACPIDKRTELFEKLEEWAYNEMGEEQREIFLTALYGASETQEAQLTIGLTKAVNKVLGVGKEGKNGNL